MSIPSRWESLIEAQIRQAQERGEFDDLPGAGKPIPHTDRPDDELWWVKDYVRREGVPTDTLLPASLRLARRVEHLPEELDRLADEAAVRETVTALNAEIVAWLRAPTVGGAAAGGRRGGGGRLARPPPYPGRDRGRAGHASRDGGHAGHRRDHADVAAAVVVPVTAGRPPVKPVHPAPVGRPPQQRRHAGPVTPGSTRWPAPTTTNSP